MKHLLRSLWSCTWLLTLFLLLGQVVTLAQNVPPRPNPPRLVNDLAGLLRPDEVAQLERKLVAYNDSTSSQIAVVTIPTLGDYEIAGYAQQLYETWGIGQKNNNNGVLILIAKQERKVRIQPGYGLEGAIPDALAKRIITSTLTPAFKENRYYEGLDRATDQLIALAKGEYKADPATQPRARRSSSDDSGSGWLFWVVIGALILFILLRNRGGGNSGGRRNRGFGGAMIPPIIFGDFSGGRGVFGGGGGGFGGGGGGFGGFGGGSSGGGGASGDW